MYGWLVKNMSPGLMPGFSRYSLSTYFAVWMHDIAWLAMVRPMTTPSPAVVSSATLQSFDCATLGEPETLRITAAPSSTMVASRCRSTSKVIASIIEDDDQVVERVDAELLARVQGEGGVHALYDRGARDAVAGPQLPMLVDRRLDERAAEPDAARPRARRGRSRVFYLC